LQVRGQSFHGCEENAFDPGPKASFKFFPVLLEATKQVLRCLKGEQVEKQMDVQAAAHLWFDGAKGSEDIAKQRGTSSGSNAVRMQLIWSTRAA
jgi:hypothetical protein